MLAGPDRVHEVCQDPLFVDFLLGLTQHEGAPTLPEMPGVDLDAYRRVLIDLLANPEVRDTLARSSPRCTTRVPARPGGSCHQLLLHARIGSYAGVAQRVSIEPSVPCRAAVDHVVRAEPVIDPSVEEITGRYAGLLATVQGVRQ